MSTREKAEALMKTKEWILALVEWEKFHESASAEEKDPNSFHDMGICKFNCGRMKEATATSTELPNYNQIMDIDLLQGDG